MEGRTTKIIQSLEEVFFGEEYFEHMRIVDSALACRSIKDFRKLKVDLLSPEIASLFRAANFVGKGDQSINAKRAEQIFNQVKAVRSNATFI